MKPVPEANPAELAPFKELVLKTCGLHLENERETTLRSALRERMSALGLKTIKSYFTTMQADPTEFGAFVERLTVNETYFMREPDHLKLCIQNLVPEIMDERRGPVRFLCAGCASGEEPYSLAILLREAHGEACENRFSIAGVDIDGQSIAAARNAVYGRNSFRGMDPGLVVRHFDTVAQGKFRLSEATQRLAAFETVNLLAEEYPPLMHRPDIILYRNVSIYFPRSVQLEVFNRLAGMLNDHGYLIVGATETMHHDLGILPLVERDGLFVFRKQPATSVANKRNASHPTLRVPSGEGPSRLSAPALTPRGTKHPPSRQTTSRVVQHLFGKALASAQARQWNEALEILGQLLRREPASIKALSLKASILMNDTRYEEARQICERILEQDTLCLEACLMLGVIARRDRDDSLAHRRFREALYLNADCWLAHYSIAEILAEKGDTKRARARYESALRILENGALLEKESHLFPLFFSARQFITICRHKLSQSKESA